MLSPFESPTRDLRNIRTLAGGALPGAKSLHLPGYMDRPIGFGPEVQLVGQVNQAFLKRGKTFGSRGSGGGWGKSCALFRIDGKVRQIFRTPERPAREMPFEGVGGSVPLCQKVWEPENLFHCGEEGCVVVNGMVDHTRTDEGRDEDGRNPDPETVKFERGTVGRGPSVRIY